MWKLQWWRRRLAGKHARQPSKRAFVAVEVVSSHREGSVRLEVITRSGHRVVVPPQFSAEHLRRVLQALEPGC